MGSELDSASSDSIADAVAVAQVAYHRLVLLVGVAGSGKTRRLRTLAARSEWPVVNLGLELTTLLRDIPPCRRPSSASDAIAQLLAEQHSDVVLLDNVEILLESSLRIQPLELLKQVSRSVTILVAWPGVFESGVITYATPGCREYRSFDARGVSVLPIQSTVSH